MLQNKSTININKVANNSFEEYIKIKLKIEHKHNLQFRRELKKKIEYK